MFSGVNACAMYFLLFFLVHMRLLRVYEFMNECIYVGIVAFNEMSEF